MPELWGGLLGSSCRWYVRNSGVNERPIENGTRPGRSAGTFGLRVVFMIREERQPISPVALMLNAMIKTVIVLRFMIPSG